MAKLTEDQEKALAELEALRDAPDDESKSSTLTNIHIDLSDANAVKLARKLGLLGGDDEEEEAGEGEGDGEGEEEEAPAPRRRGFYAS